MLPAVTSFERYKTIVAHHLAKPPFMIQYRHDLYIAHCVILLPEPAWISCSFTF